MLEESEFTVSNFIKNPDEFVDENEYSMEESKMENS
jgi:hypothetical protein